MPDMRAPSTVCIIELLTALRSATPRWERRDLKIPLYSFLWRLRLARLIEYRFDLATAKHPSTEIWIQ
jgi:hypothetical protein